MAIDLYIKWLSFLDVTKTERHEDCDLYLLVFVPNLRCHSFSDNSSLPVTTSVILSSIACNFHYRSHQIVCIMGHLKGIKSWNNGDDGAWVWKSLWPVEYQSYQVYKSHWWVEIKREWKTTRRLGHLGILTLTSQHLYEHYRTNCVSIYWNGVAESIRNGPSR